MLGLGPWFRNWRKVAVAAGHEFLRGHRTLFWDGHWVSKIHSPSHKGHHPVGPHWPNAKKPALPAFPRELGSFVQRLHYSPIWCQSHFYTEYTGLARSQLAASWTLTPSELILLPPSASSFFSSLEAPHPLCACLGWDRDVCRGQFCSCLYGSESSVLIDIMQTNAWYCG